MAFLKKEVLQSQREGTNARKNQRRRPISKARLKGMIEQATVDAYNESEQITGWFMMIDENLAVPFETTVLGVPVTVERLDLNHSEQIVAVCTRGRSRQSLPILDLPLPTPPPDGAEWIECISLVACRRMTPSDGPTLVRRVRLEFEGIWKYWTKSHAAAGLLAPRFGVVPFDRFAPALLRPALYLRVDGFAIAAMASSWASEPRWCAAPAPEDRLPFAFDDAVQI
jgi:calcium binding protein